MLKAMLTSSLHSLVRIPGLSSFCEKQLFVLTGKKTVVGKKLETA